MVYKHPFTLDFKFIFAAILFTFCFTIGTNGQTILRQSLSCLGNSVYSNGLTIQSTMGQSSAIGTYSNSDVSLQQGFLQPFSSPMGVIKPEIKIAVYPNPSSGEYNIEMEFQPGDYYRVVNILGKEILKTDIQNTSTNETFNLSSYSKGFYFLTIYRNGKSIETKKLILTQ